MKSLFPGRSVRPLPSRGFRGAVVGATFVCMSLFLAACAGSAPELNGESEIVVGISADPRTLLTTETSATNELLVSAQISEKLLEFSVDSTEIVPSLATEWNQVDDVTLRVNLREDVSFSNGEPFNAESAVYSLNEVLGTSATYASYASILEGASVVDEFTIDVKAVSPTSQLPMVLAVAGFQFPMEYFKEVGAEGFAKEPVGTGPFVLDSWSSGDKITMSANTAYWNGEPSVDKVSFQVIPDKQAQMAAAQSGQVDLVIDIPVGSMSTIESAQSLELVMAPSMRVYFLALSTLTDTPLREPAVRRALWHAIDVEALISDQLGGSGTPLDGQILTSNYFGFQKEMTGGEYDPELAKQLLAKAGYPDGFEITFKYSSGRYPQDSELGQAIATQLAKVGITTVEEVLEPGTFIQQLNNQELNDIYLTGSLPAPDAHYMYQIFKSDGQYSYVRMPALDALIAEETAAVDQDERYRIFGEIAELLQEDPAFVPLFNGVDSYAVNDRIEGFEPRANQFIDLHRLTVS